MDEYVELAKNAVEAYLKRGILVSSEKRVKSTAKDQMQRKRGVFVSIHTKAGKLRGCIGTPYKTSKNIGELIVENAISAARNDFRFTPVTEDELDNLVYKVDVLSDPEPVENTGELDAKKYGVIVRHQDGRAGLLLPALPGIETAHQQIEIALQKAGINPQEKYQLSKFTVERHE